MEAANPQGQQWARQGGSHHSTTCLLTNALQSKSVRVQATTYFVTFCASGYNELLRFLGKVYIYDNTVSMDVHDFFLCLTSLASECSFSVANWTVVTTRLTAPQPHSGTSFLWFNRAVGFAGPVLLLLRGFSGRKAWRGYGLLFDTARQEWSRVQMDPGVGHRGLLTGAYQDRYAFVAGGQTRPGCRRPKGDVWVLDLATRMWIRLPSLPQPLLAGAGIIHGTAFHVLGGFTTRGMQLETTGVHCVLDFQCALPDLLTGVCMRWAKQPPLPVPAAHMASVVVGSQWYTLGGESGGQTESCTARKLRPHNATGHALVVHDHAWIYDLALQTWRRSTNMPIPTSRAEGQVLWIGEYVVLLGGMHFNNLIHGLIQVHDRRTERWVVLNQTLARPVSGALMWTEPSTEGGLSLYQNGGRTTLVTSAFPGAVGADTLRAQVRLDLHSVAIRRISPLSETCLDGPCARL